MADLGTAFLRVRPDMSGLNAQMVGYFRGSSWKKMGVAAGAALGAGIVAGGAAKALYEIGEEFDRASDKIRVGTGATGKSLDKLNKSFKEVLKDVPTDFDSASTAIADLNTRLGLTGKPLERMAKQMTELSRITETDVGENIRTVTRAFGDWEVATGKQSDMLDYFFKAAQASGAEVSELADQVVQFGAPLRQVGFDIETATAMFASFEKAGVNVQTMMPGLRMALKFFVAEGTDPVKGLKESFEGISSGALDAADAAQIFGVRAANDMFEAVKQNRFELDDFTRALDKNNETIRDAGRDTMSLAEHWQRFKNNVLVALEPVATRVFDAVGREMRKVTRILTDESLTNEEKFSAVFAQIKDSIGRYAPEIIGAARDLGAEVFRGMVRGIGEALTSDDLLVQSMTGAASLKMMSKVGGKWGTAAGRAFPIALLAALNIALWGDEKNRSLIALGGKQIGQWLVNGIIDVVNIGVRRINDILGGISGLPGVSDLEIGEIGHVDFVGMGSAEAVGEALRTLRSATEEVKAYDKAVKDARPNVLNMNDAIGKQWVAAAKESAAATKDTGREVRKYGDDTKRSLDAANTASGKHEQAVTRDQAKVRDSFDKTGDKGRTFGDRITDYFGGVVRDSGKMSTKTSGNFSGLTDSVSDALKVMGENVNAALKALRVQDAIKFSIKQAKKATKAVMALQRGGHINLGAPSGDSVPAMLERNEYVLNQRAVDFMGGPRVLDAINFGMAPRFQKGGSVTGDTDYLPAVHQALMAMSSASGRSIYVQSGGRTLAEQQALYDAYLNGTGNLAAPPNPNAPHVRGVAADITPGREAFGSVAGKFGLGFTVPSESWHIELLGGGGKGSPDLASVPKIADILLQGPDGPLKKLGQSAINRAVKAARKFVSSKIPKSTVSAPSVASGGSLQSYARKLVTSAWGADQWPYFNDLVNRESSWNPQAVNPSSGAAGLAQALPPSKYPAGAWPYTGKESAFKQLQWMVSYIQGRYGTPAAAIGFHDANNWYQQGGLVEYLRGGGKPGRKRKRKRQPKKDFWIPSMDHKVDPRVQAVEQQQILATLAKQNAILDEKIEIAEHNAGRLSSPGGTETTPGEAYSQRVLYGELLNNLLRKVHYAKQGIGVVRNAMKFARPKDRKKLRKLISGDGGFQSTIDRLQGLTGRGGEILQARLQIEALGGTINQKPDKPTPLDLSGLSSIIEAAKLNAFAGTFATGGKIGPGKWGITGERGPEIVHGPATVTPIQQGGQQRPVDVKVEMHWEGYEFVVDTFVDGKLEQRERQNALDGIAGVGSMRRAPA